MAFISGGFQLGQMVDALSLSFSWAWPYLGRNFALKSQATIKRGRIASLENAYSMYDQSDGV